MYYVKPELLIYTDLCSYIEDCSLCADCAECLGLRAVRGWEGGNLVLWGCQRSCLERWCGRRLGGFRLCVQCEYGIFRWYSGVFLSYGDVLLALCCRWGQRSVHCLGGVVQNWKGCQVVLMSEWSVWCLIFPVKCAVWTTNSGHSPAVMFKCLWWHYSTVDIVTRWNCGWQHQLWYFGNLNSKHHSRCCQQQRHQHHSQSWWHG